MLPFELMILIGAPSAPAFRKVPLMIVPLRSLIVF